METTKTSIGKLTTMKCLVLGMCLCLMMTTYGQNGGPGVRIHENGNVVLRRGVSTCNQTQSLTINGAQCGTLEYAKLIFSNYDNADWPMQVPTAMISSANVNGQGDTDLRFYTFDVPDLKQRMLITHTGRIGIGVESPAQPLEKLHVFGGNLRLDRGNFDAGTTRRIHLGGAQGGSVTFGEITFGNYDFDDYPLDLNYARISSKNSEGSPSGDLRFATRASPGSVLTDRVVIGNTGNVTFERGSSTNSITRVLRLNGARNSAGNDVTQIQFSNYDDDSSPTDLVRAMISSTNSDGMGNGDLRFHTFNGTLNEVMRIEGGGNVGIGAALNPAHPLHMQSGAHVTAGGVWTNASDIAKKYDISSQNYGLAEIMRLRPVSYSYKADGSRSIGFIAQEIGHVIPEVVSGVEGEKGIAYGLLVSTVVRALQQQQEVIEAQALEINKLKNLENEVLELKRIVQQLAHPVAAGQ